MFAKIAIKSLFNRKGSVLISLIAMTVSIFVLLGVEHIRHQAKENFANTVSGVDLIVGARTGSVNLLLFSIFRIGNPINNISWESFKDIASGSDVKWAIPISLGDSHRGYRVLGTTEDYFQHYSYGKKHRLAFSQGKAFAGIFDVVLGSEVAKKLSYQLGDKLVLAHGMAKTSFTLHENHPFNVVGILKPTGTPVDQTLHVSLQGIEAIHSNWQGGVHIPGSGKNLDQLNPAQLEPKSITAFMLGLKSKITTFRVLGQVNNYAQEPLMAILPGVALTELWQMIGVLENILLLVSVLVFVSACLGVTAMLLSSMREREREIYLLRVLGAHPVFVFLLIQMEALFITIASILLGSGMLAACLAIAQDYLLSHFGLHIESSVFSKNTLLLLGLVLISSFLATLIPSIYGFKKAKVSAV